MKNSLETKLGVFVVLVVFAAWAIMETLGGMEMFRGGYHVNAQFDTVQELKVGSAVKMGGVEIGKVEKIALDEANNKVNVTMKLHPDAIVKTDSKASIRFTGLMGQNYVSHRVSARRAAARSWTAPCWRRKNSPTSTPSWPSSTRPPPALRIWARVSPATKLTICSAR